MGLPVAMGAYIYTLIFVSEFKFSLLRIVITVCSMT
jgi:hypothetical protein